MADPHAEEIPDPKRYSNCLLLLARRMLPRWLAHRVSESDLVQETLARAWVQRAQYRGQNEEQFEGWLREILRNEVKNRIRDNLRQRRDVRRELELFQQFDDSCRSLDEYLTGPDTPPEQRAVRNEELHRLAEALPRLPPEQRELLTLRYVDRLKYGVIAARLGRSSGQVAGLLRRAVEALRKLLEEKDGS